jgi:hypothetical protein
VKVVNENEKNTISVHDIQRPSNEKTIRLTSTFGALIGTSAHLISLSTRGSTFRLHAYSFFTFSAFHGTFAFRIKGTISTTLRLHAQGGYRVAFRTNICTAARKTSSVTNLCTFRLHTLFLDMVTSSTAIGKVCTITIRVNGTRITTERFPAVIRRFISAFSASILKTCVTIAEIWAVWNFGTTTTIQAVIGSKCILRKRQE